MTRFNALLIVILAALVALASACGGGSGASSGKLEDNDVAVVGDIHITRDQLDHQIQLRLNAAKVDNAQLPKIGTDDYKNQVIIPIVQRLVTNAEIQNIAKGLDVSVSDADIQKKLDEAVKREFKTDTKKYQDYLKKYGITEDDLKEQVIRPSLLQTKIQEKLKEQYKITDAQVQAYFDDHKAEFITPDSREVHYVIVKNKADATAARAQIAGGTAWGKVYKQYSLDYSPGTPAAQLGKFKAQKGQTETNFGTAVFGASLKTGELSPLVEVSQQYATSSLPGKCKPTCYFVIRPDADIVKGKTQTFDEVKAQVKQTLEQSVQAEKITKRIQQLAEEQKKQVRYAKGFAPPKPVNPGGASTGG
jgi:foldase protein PrsA